MNTNKPYSGQRKPRDENIEKWAKYFEVHPEAKDKFPDMDNKVHVKAEPAQVVDTEPTKPISKKKVNEYKFRDGPIHLSVGEDEHVSLNTFNGRGEKYWSDELQAVVYIHTLNGESGVAGIAIEYQFKMIPIEELNKMKLRSYNEKVLIGESVLLSDNTKLIHSSQLQPTVDADPKKKYNIRLVGSLEKIKLC